MSQHARLQHYDYGITCIDTELFRPGLACCYLVQEGDEAAFIDTGTRNSVPLLLEALAVNGLSLNQVRWVMPTHVHLDHAGGAGALLQVLPEAQLLVHERGAAHMISPQKLQAGSLAVYGQARYQAAFGDLVPVPEHRVKIACDGDRVALGSREFQIIDTPGHARHHYVVWDKLSRGLFCGDSFGVSYPELNDGTQRFIFPPTTPVQFDPTAWHTTIERLLAFDAQHVYLTHFGRHNEVREFGEELHRQIDAYVEYAERMAKDSNPQSEKFAELLMLHSQNLLKLRDSKVPPDVTRRLLGGDMELNAQGLLHWLQRQSS
jgi:glyoxylase-like metal-dependent hydrolase (beta-lactamase superfamily II)